MLQLPGHTILDHTADNYNLVHLHQLNVSKMRGLVSFIVLVGLAVLVPGKVCAQWMVQRDSLSVKGCESVCKGGKAHKFWGTQLISPAALLAVGAIGSGIDDFKEIDFGLADRGHHGSQGGEVHHSGGFVAEDVVQYVPAAGFYALKLSGVKSVHNYRDASVILVASCGITAVATKVVKEIAGAGIGILGTRVAYWIYPSVQRLLFGKIFKCKDMGNTAFMGLPYYDGTGAGVSHALRF